MCEHARDFSITPKVTNHKTMEHRGEFSHKIKWSESQSCGSLAQSTGKHMIVSGNGHMNGDLWCLDTREFAWSSTVCHADKTPIPLYV